MYSCLLCLKRVELSCKIPAPMLDPALDELRSADVLVWCDMAWCGWRGDKTGLAEEGEVRV